MIYNYSPAFLSLLCNDLFNIFKTTNPKIISELIEKILAPQNFTQTVNLLQQAITHFTKLDFTKKPSLISAWKVFCRTYPHVLQLADGIAIKTTQNELNIPKSLLEIQSPVFKRMLNSGLSESIKKQILLENDDADHFISCLQNEEWDEIITGDNVVNILRLAHQYHVPTLLKYCLGYLEDNLNLDNIIPILEEVINLGMAEIFTNTNSKYLKYIRKNYDDIKNNSQCDQLLQLARNHHLLDLEFACYKINSQNCKLSTDGKLYFEIYSLPILPDKEDLQKIVQWSKGAVLKFGYSFYNNLEHIPSNEIDLFIQLVEKSNPILILDFSFNEINDDSLNKKEMTRVQNLVKLLKNIKMSALDLGHNLELHFNTSFCEALQNHPTLRSLSREANCFDLLYFVNWLKNNKTLTHLNLSYNHFKINYIKKILEAIESNPSLIDLKLTNCKLTDIAATTIAEKIKAVNLHYLDLSNNLMSITGVKLLVEAMKSHSTLIEVDLRFNCLNFGEIAEIEDSLKDNEKLKFKL